MRRLRTTDKALIPKITVVPIQKRVDALTRRHNTGEIE